MDAGCLSKVLAFDANRSMMSDYTPFSPSPGENAVSINQIVMIVAGFMVLLSVALTHFVHPNWMWFTVFIGANMFQSGFTGFCPLVIVLKKLGIGQEA
ncbi:hypothetical protein MAIT1_02202 [Magnetofaba australis IT-1]|uniref:Inner membrane protein YgaP-like transmembrane domain-containing protein n=1 Tax=Magnetofaba australis IT-1 TaxID=1434232 RepID=A0A1Y2K2B8_9PROT|nr:hypothetical protein MAIT1_02202 [Magnetofaba australis IT-1]